MSSAARHRSLQAKARRCATKPCGAQASLTLHLNRLQTAAAPPRSMRFSFVPLLKVNLGVVVSLFLLRVTFPRLIGLLVRRMSGLLVWVIFRRLFAHGIPPA